MEHEELLTTEGAWGYLGISRATFFKLVQRYRVPRYRKPLEGKRVFFKKSDLDKLREPVREDVA